MKKIMRIDLYLCAIAWSLFLNDLEVLGILVSIIGVVYICYFVKKINYWRLISLTIMISIFSILVVRCSTIESIYQLILPFLILMSLNISLVNELCCLLKTQYFKTSYYIITMVMFVFGIIALVIPDVKILPNYKTNLIIFITLIFFPYFLITSINLLYRRFAIRKKKVELALN